MGWISSNPTVPGRDLPAPGRELFGGRDPRDDATRAAWVPSNARVLPEAFGQIRLDGIAFVGAGSLYLVLAMLLIAVGGLQGALGTASFLPVGFVQMEMLVAIGGWLGLTLCGVLNIFLPSQIGIAYRPAWVARVHLGVVNIALLGYVIAGLVWGLGTTTSAFILLLGGSYLLFSVPLLLALLLAFQDWRSGEL